MKSDSTEMYLRPTDYLDFEHPVLQELCVGFQKIADESDRAIAIYLFVRDRFLYDPYHLDLRKEALTASHILTKKRAWCVEKAVVCCALMRGCGIPARLGFGIVRNHIGVEKLLEYLKRPEIVFHGYVEAFVNHSWSKCTPAFDQRVCRISGVEPLQWNGRDDSLFHAFKGEEKYMEYLHFYGDFADIPLELMHTEMAGYYPHLFEEPIHTPAFSFHFEARLNPLQSD